MPEKAESIKFTVDGRPFTVDDPMQTAASLLELAGLDPAGYDLAEIRPGGAGPKRFKDSQPVRVKNGDEFISIREQATVA